MMSKFVSAIPFPHPASRSGILLAVTPAFVAAIRDLWFSSDLKPQMAGTSPIVTTCN
jgi:hypothetical protein